MEYKAKKLVIGGGISGLSFAFYHNDSFVVAEEQSKKDSPFVFIQKNIYTETMAHDLKLPTEYEEVLVYPKESDDVLTEKVGSVRSFFSGTDKIANIGEDFILKVLSLKESVIVERLYSAVKDRVKHDRVQKIDGHTAFLESGDKVVFEELISTMHFKTFEKVYGGWEAGDEIRLVKMFIDEVEDSSLSKSRISYNCAKGVKKMVENRIVGSVGYELVDGKDREGSCREFSRFTGRINPPPKGVTFTGRFATANTKWRIEDSLFIAQSGYEFSKMMAEQKRFDKAILYTDKVGDEERCKNLVLHMHSEASELLREINWKTNSYSKKKVKATSVLEECIDIMKLSYAVLGVFNYTEREVYEAFYSKSRVMWDRFLTDFYGNV